MTVQTNECNLCDAEFDIMHTEDSVIKYCPFCGEDLIKDSVEEDWLDDYEWDDDSQMYSNPWIYQGEIFNENLVDRYYGMVYCITSKLDGRKYIGRKTFWFMRKKRGAKRRSKLESDWRVYYGSSVVLKELIKISGKDRGRNQQQKIQNEL